MNGGFGQIQCVAEVYARDGRTLPTTTNLVVPRTRIHVLEKIPMGGGPWTLDDVPHASVVDS